MFNIEEIEIIRKKGVKKITLRIDKTKRKPVITIPYLCRKKSAYTFAEKNLVWIENQLLKIPPKKEIIDGSEISVLGKKYIIKHQPKAKRGVWIENDSINISGEIDFIERRLKDFLKKMSREELSKLTHQKAQATGKKINKIVLKDTKTRWGSCSTKNNLNFNWRIVMAPIEIMDYLVSHEVSHLTHHDHSKNFWGLVGELHPNYKKNRKWLQTHGDKLFSYF